MFIDIQNKFGKIRYYSNDEFMIGCADYQIFFEQEYVENYLSGFIRRSKVALDIGAHAGSHTVMYKKINKDIKIHAFEPQSKMYELLVHNVISNNLSNVYCYNMAVGNKNGSVAMTPYSTDGTNAMGSIEYGTDDIFNIAGVQIGHGGENVVMTKIDDIITDDCDFIKIDIEGYEPNALLGAMKLINRCRPVISFEFNEKTTDDCEMTTFDVLKMYNYKYKRVWYDNWIAMPFREEE